MRLRLATALLLLWVLIPGLSEASEDFAHALLFGHAVHDAQPSSGHDDSNPEHGCTGTFHLCVCHTTPSSILSAGSDGNPALDSRRLIPAERSGTPDGIPSPFEHVPRA